MVAAVDVSLIVVGVCAVAPMYGVTRYDVTVPPEAGATQATRADVWPAEVAVTPVTVPGR